MLAQHEYCLGFKFGIKMLEVVNGLKRLLFESLFYLPSICRWKLRVYILPRIIKWKIKIFL